MDWGSDELDEAELAHIGGVPSMCTLKPISVKRDSMFWWHALA